MKKTLTIITALLLMFTFTFGPASVYADKSNVTVNVVAELVPYIQSKYVQAVLDVFVYT